MGTNIIQCDFCGKVVKMREAHGWLDVKVWSTQPSPDEVRAMREHPSMSKLLDLEGIREGEEAPALVGGDFCCLDHIAKFYQAQATLQGVDHPGGDAVVQLEDNDTIQISDGDEDYFRMTPDEALDAQMEDGSYMEAVMDDEPDPDDDPPETQALLPGDGWLFLDPDSGPEDIPPNA